MVALVLSFHQSSYVDTTENVLFSLDFTQLHCAGLHYLPSSVVWKM
jgi:hypothetical protein